MTRLNSDNVKNASPWKNVPKKLLPFIVKKVVAVHEPVSGGTYYSLQGIGNAVAIVDPRHDMPMYQRMIALVPEIATLPKRDAIVLARFWSVTPCWTTRVGKDVMIPKTITELPPVERDFPTWATSDDDMQDFADMCHTVWSPAIAGNFLDTTFGLPRSAWPDRQTCIDKVGEIMKATGLRQTPEVKPPSELDAFLDNYDKREDTVSIWASDNKELAAFWKAVNSKNNKHQQWRDMTTEDRTEFARTILGSKLHEVTRPREECQELVIHEANERFGDIENKNGQEQANSQSTQETTADNVIPLHQSPKNSVPVDSTTPDKKTVRKENTIKISGQDYLKASGRVIMWKLDHPDWTLETDAIAVAPDFAVFKASIKNAEGRIVSTGHGMCTPELAKKVSGRFVEKAETAAIARALALAGYGTDDTLDDSDYISDSPLSKTG